MCNLLKFVLMIYLSAKVFNHGQKHDLDNLYFAERPMLNAEKGVNIVGISAAVSMEKLPHSSANFRNEAQNILSLYANMLEGCWHFAPTSVPFGLYH